MKNENVENFDEKLVIRVNFSLIQKLLNEIFNEFGLIKIQMICRNCSQK